MLGVAGIMPDMISSCMIIRKGKATVISGQLSRHGVSLDESKNGSGSDKVS